LPDWDWPGLFCAQEKLSKDNCCPIPKNKSFAPPRPCVEKCRVQIRFLIGPAGSGKTHRCLAEIREALLAAPEGQPLILLAPKQATFQLERQLLGWGERTREPGESSEPGSPEVSPRQHQIQGYTRLHILSFERLARFVFDQLGQPPPQMLNEEGRLMVLRALLARRRNDLKLFRASARLTGFAAQLSLALRELQRNLLTPEALLKLADDAREHTGLSLKLHDLATLLRDYLDWLTAHDLQDADCLLDAATAALAGSSGFRVSGFEFEDGHGPRRDAQLETKNSKPEIAALWLDGFAEFSAQESDLLAAVVSHCERATIAFCLDPAAAENTSWLSNWSLVKKTFEETKNRLADLPGAKVSVESLRREADKNRFSGNPALAHLEKFWAEPIQKPEFKSRNLGSAVCVAVCPNPEAEATLAAREILRFVRAGGRFREASVIVRTFEGYHQILQRVFSLYDIPFFLDRRESVSHHPLAELTRSALRVAAFNWAHDDLFAALKTGLVPAEETQLDQLENEALARGWKGATWQRPIQITDDVELSKRLERLRKKIIPPFQNLANQFTLLQNRPNGKQLAAALRAFWNALNLEEQLQTWADQISNPEFQIPNSVHATVWEQLNAWLDNVAQAFPNETISLHEWLPILEAGMAGLAVGVIPPALDQVLVGAIDRSRNPDIQLALVLGLNEGVFPAPPPPAELLTDADRDELERRGIALGTSARQHIGRERYFGYIACTRARQRLVLTCSAFDTNDKPLNPSPFLSRIKQLFPQLEFETPPRTSDWRESEHAHELIAPVLKIKNSKFEIKNWDKLAGLPALKLALDRLRHFQIQPAEESLSPELAGRLYGATLRTSVSRLEQFAACPFRFFVHSGLRAEERKAFELDVREQGSFQHDALKLFHEQLHDEGKRWRDITPREARERIGRIAKSLVTNYREGLMQSSEDTKFTARVLIESLQDFVETLVDWMARQYAFDPVAVELPFGESDTHPAWELDLGEGRRLALRGRIDRVDVCRDASSDEALCVVVDYKSSQKKLDSLLIANGLQLQLLAYLNVLRHWPNPRELFGAARLIPAGVFYVNLRGKYNRQPNRANALAEIEDARKLAYQHSGRFDARALLKLDSREDAVKGDQFNYRKNKDGSLSKNSRDALTTEEFVALLDSVEVNLKTMGRAIFSGAVQVSPYRKGAMTACDQCDYQTICRIDPWTHPFRALKKDAPA
jgi:ATP-dependent helicase/nuclease subunit B